MRTFLFILLVSTSVLIASPKKEQSINEKPPYTEFDTFPLVYEIKDDKNVPPDVRYRRMVNAFRLTKVPIRIDIPAFNTFTTILYLNFIYKNGIYNYKCRFDIDINLGFTQEKEIWTFKNFKPLDNAIRAEICYLDNDDLQSPKMKSSFYITNRPFSKTYVSKELKYKIKKKIVESINEFALKMR